ncbi:hypothetical protein AC629_40000 [Bradyrhizobium sp. NAS80.1]|uniref:hypothetical protein n=1 Tax=Bradyrhizobium sp. NAS80.1 TaxID=1680159 RepID=UPI00096A17A4|nr:hypothetical protein [Bradyrhizobium sp. NAS80.1]OKO70746.1 hypothetical protein AC629_40000 [Bradyrhizobium sp. NAS80.1]
MKRFRIGGRCGAGKRQMVRTAASVLVPAFAIVLAAGKPAHADCTPQAADNVTANCTGTTINPRQLFGYGTGVETGVTVDVASGARVTGFIAGIDLSSATVTNNAGASITGGWFGISTSTDVTVTNDAGGSITGGDFGIFAGAGGSSVSTPAASGGHGGDPVFRQRQHADAGAGLGHLGYCARQRQ